ncbi:MAG: hypothetical protein WAN86_22490 [Hyphomicrobiaceae bacterium]
MLIVDTIIQQGVDPLDFRAYLIQRVRGGDDLDPALRLLVLLLNLALCGAPVQRSEALHENACGDDSLSGVYAQHDPVLSYRRLLERRKRKYIQRSRIKASHIDAGEREESRTVDQYESIHVADFLSSVLGCVQHVENKTVVASLSVIFPVADAQCGPGDFHTDVFPIPASIEVVDAADPWAQFFDSGRIDVQKGIETPGTGSAPLLSAASARLGEQAMVM